MRKWLIILCIGTYQHTFAQHKLRIEVSIAPPAIADSLFLTGNFNYWKPADPDHSFINENGKWVYERDGLQRGVYEFKFSRSATENITEPDEGNVIRKNVLQLISDTTLSFTLYYPLVQSGVVEAAHSRSENVRIDSVFKIDDGRIKIYLPPGYKNSTKRYPVIYMYGGEHLFDAQPDNAGEWGIDEAMDSLIKAGKSAAIIVGIESMQALSENIHNKTREHIQLITNRLKPYIDKKYRTNPTKENTIIAGSAASGYMAFYAALNYPDIFGRAGMFSPSFHLMPEASDMTDSLASRSRGMFFFYRGELEENGEAEMADIIYRMGRSSNALLYTVSDPDGKQNTEAWRKWFPEFYLWVMSNGLNHIIR